ncbi:MAG: dienelactone hydrolase family protein [Methylobacter sp.]
MISYSSISRFILGTCLLLLTTGYDALGEQSPLDTLATDAIAMTQGDLAGLGPQPVDSSRVEVPDKDESLEVVLYKPARPQTPAPAVVFLPGRMASDDQYQSYARALASRGFVVAVRTWYSLFRTDLELAYDAKVIADWLVNAQGADTKRVGIAGHSMGGKDAVLAAAQYGGFASVVAIDPDDNGNVSVVHGLLASLKAPLLLIGAEVAWRASSVCAPLATNYLRFFEQAPAGTVELTLRDADHVQMLDEPDRFGYGICRSGTADSRQVRITARRATVGFFLQHLQGWPALPKPASGQATIRVAQAYPFTEK